MGNATPQDQWEEYLAMYIVEDTFPYGRFKKMECSDLHGDDVGIEVIRARPKTFEERRSYISGGSSAKPVWSDHQPGSTASSPSGELMPAPLINPCS